MTERIDWLRSTLVGGAQSLGACAAGAAPSTTAPPAEVTVEGFLFQQDSIEIEAGETVVWHNEDRILHTVTSGEPEDPDGVFDGDLPDAGAEFEWTFDEPGTYEYFCSRHPHMTGVVIVRG